MDDAKKFLEGHGYVVIENVIASEVCKRLITEYQDWWSRFGEDYPTHINSIMHKYKVGHLAMTWEVRLLVQKVFAAVWQTKKLLTSFDGIAISEPPEMGHMPFANKHSLHLDQASNRPGLHAYQGAVYLEEQTAEDHCFQILSHSHAHFETYFAHQARKNPRRPGDKFTRLNQKDMKWFLLRGCTHLRIPVSEGSVLLWDSRLVHDGAAPIEGRTNNTRWRHVNFVSMTPAKWASEEDLMKKQDHYYNMLTSRHWSSMGVSCFKSPKSVYDIKEMPDIAKTDEAKLLAGVKQYDFNDGSSNGPDWTPTVTCY